MSTAPEDTPIGDSVPSITDAPPAKPASAEPTNVAPGSNVSSGGHILPNDVRDPNDPQRLYDAAQQYMINIGLVPTPDALDQLVFVFSKCLYIMTTRPWDPKGGTWRESGIKGVLTDSRKKFRRFWERFWTHGASDDSAYDSGLDLINYIAFVLRSDPASGWGDWGEPGGPTTPSS